MPRFFFSATDEYRKKLPYGFAGVGCFYEQEHVKRPGGREETEWVYPFYQWIQCREGSGEVWLQGKKYGISKSTVHKDVSVRLKQINPELYEQVKQVLTKNRDERHIRGGIATKLKYSKE